MSKTREFVMGGTVDISNKKEIKDSKYWWKLTGNELSASIFSLIQTINNMQYNFWQVNFIYAQLYENIDSLVNVSSSPLFSQYFDISPTNQVYNSKLTYNVVKSCVDAATAKIAKNKPRVKFVTNNGDYKLQKKAKQLTQYMDGMFEKIQMHRKGVASFRDAGIFGTGAIKIYIEDGEIKADRVLAPVEIVVDNSDARYGKPKQLHQRKVVSKEVLQAMYPSNIEEIESATTLPNTLSVTPDQIIVTESWHLPSTKSTKDGKHCICINGATLFEEEYVKDYFPFIFFNWGARVQGFWGYGLTEELSFTQLAINKTHKMIQAAQEINCVPRWMVEQGSLLNKHSFYDAGIMEYKTGSNPPQANMQPAVPGDLYAYLETLFNKAYQISGISQLSAASAKPPGVNSGVALREYQDINTERFAIQGEQYEQFFVDAAKIIIDLSRDLYKGVGGKKVNISVKAKSNNKKFIQSIDWDSCNLEDDQFNMECFPVSKLPTTPEGRLEFITNLAQAGYIQQSQVMELMEMPDIDNFFSLTNASFDVTVQDMDDMIEENEPRTPEPYMDLKMAKIIAQAYYLKSKVSGVDEDRLELIRQYIQNCELLLNPPPADNKPTPNAGAVPQSQMPQTDPNMAGPAPMANPQAPPTSDLMPVNQQ